MVSVTRLQHRLGAGPLEGQQAHLRRDVPEPDVALLLGDDVVPVLLDVGRVDDQHHLVLEAIDGAIVDDPAMAVQEAGVLHLARLQRADVVGGDPVDECIPIRAGDLELPHVADIEDPGMLANRLVLGEDARGILDRHLPAGKGHHLRAEGDVGVVERGAAQGRVRHMGERENGGTGERERQRWNGRTGERGNGKAGERGKHVIPRTPSNARGTRDPSNFARTCRDPSLRSG